VFRRLAFEKGPAYSDEVKDEKFEAPGRPSRRRAKKAKGLSRPDKPPEAFPGP